MYPINRIQVGMIFSFALGILAFDKASVLSVTYLYFLLLSSLLFLLMAKRLSFKWLLLSFVCFFLGSGLLLIKTPEALSEQNEKVFIEGRVIKSEVGKHELFLMVDRLNEDTKKPFKLALKKSYQDEGTYLLGGRYQFEGQLLLPERPTNLGGFDEAAYLKSKGIFYTLKASHAGKLLASPKGIDHFILKQRQWFKATFLTYLAEEEAYFLEAVLFGEKGHLDRDFYALAQKMGLAHLFAVSGLHVGFLALVLVFLFKQMPYKNTLFMLIFLGLVLSYYSLLVGGVYSALRASGLIFLTYLLKHFTLYRDLPTILAWLLAIILIFNPFALYDMGLVLSFCLALGLGLFYKRLRGLLPKRTKYLPKPVLDGLILSFVAELISLPLVAYYFYMVTPFGIFYNFLLVPFFSLIVPLSFLACAFALFFPSLAKVLFLGLHFVLKSFFFSFESLYALFKTGHYYVGMPSVFWLIGYGLFLIGLYQGLLKARDKRVWCFFIGVFLILLFFLPNPAPKNLRLSVVDVGQGSGATYQLKNGKWLVFDTGPSQRTLSNHLRYMGVNEIEAIVLSHGDKDHVGGLYELLRDFKVNHLILSQYAYETSENLAYLREKSPQLKLHFVDERLRLSLGTDSELLLDLVAREQVSNGYEVVAFLKEGDKSYLFPGDTDKRFLAEIDFPYPVSLILVPHHGSRHSFDEAFYKHYRPSLAIVSAGRVNRFSHPHREVTLGLEAMGMSYLNTSEAGGLYFYEKNGDLVLRKGLLN